VGAIVRALWLRYRITNRRITVTGGWMGRSHRHYLLRNCQNVKFPRYWLLGRYGVNVRDGSPELRAVPKFRDIYNYINEKVAARKSRE